MGGVLSNLKNGDIIIQVLVVMQSSIMATEIPAFNEDVMCGTNYALCLETVPRQRLTIHLDDREH